MTARKQKIGKEHCFCPYCDAEIAEVSSPYCQVCEIEVFFCPKCRKPVKRENKLCPNCGTEIKG